MSLGSLAHILGAQGVQRRTDRKINKDLPKQLSHSGIVQPGGVHTRTCRINWVVEEKGRPKNIRFRETFGRVVSWQRREVSRSSVYRRLREPFAETEGDEVEYPVSQKVGASNSLFVSRRYAGGVVRRLVSGY